MQHGKPSAIPDDGFPLSFREFLGLVAALMAVNALSIDPMLPALPAIGHSLHVDDANSRQWIITAYFLGLGGGSLLYGPISDRFGRRPVLLVTISLMIVATLACALAQNFAMMLAGRAAAGFFAAASRVIAVSIVRDRFHGDAMARVMSLVFIVFMLVPVLAPSLGQLVLLVAPWRWIFGGLAIVTLAIAAWVALRLPETLDPAHRISIHPGDLADTIGRVLRNRSSIGYMLASGVVMGPLIGFITSAQQIFFDVFDAPGLFAIGFALIAGSMVIGSYSNSRLVEKLGARRVSQTAVIAIIVIESVHCLVAYAGMETVASFIGLQALTMICFALTGSNFGAISMEPFARGAGMASSFQTSLTTILSALLGAFIGSMFDGTTLPLSLGFALCSALSLLIVAWAERWKLFTRPHHGALREPANAPR